MSGNPELSASLDDSRVTQGEDRTLNLQVNNQGEVDYGSASGLESQVTKARGMTVDLRSGSAPVTIETNQRTVGQLSGESSTQVPFDISVAENAEPGIYTLTAEVEYEYYSKITQSDAGLRSYNEQSETDTFQVTLRVEDSARFEIVDTESDVQIGSTGTVGVIMENTGTETASDASVELESLNSDLTFGQSSSGTRYAGEWEPGERKTIEYRVTASDNAEQQRYAFRVTASYDDSDGVTRQSKSRSLGVTPLPETNFELSNVEPSLRVGEDGTISGTVRNGGDLVARDVVVRLTGQLQNLNPTDREYSVGTLEPGQAADFDMEIEVNDAAASGPKQFVFVADYRDTEGDSRTSDDLPARVDVAPGSDAFAVSIVNGSVEDGGSTTIGVEVTNTANETLSAISAKMFADSPISVSDSEAYIDELGPGESTTIGFSVGASDALPKQYPLSVDFEYDDADGDTLLSDRYRLPIDVEESSGGGGFPLPLIGVGVVVVVAIGGYMRFR
ncbi:COG1361 S-layer family protein [Halorientalis sp.]|uniref:COG1361 S-layer family protein n=1 Tax=Halorientalis sp. TaxID=1931229 RepID=UPI00262A7390|nr:COG1361 S-layer family protein [Halorientalis sp.]